MKSVKINNVSYDIDTIISFGCSFTAGEELLDEKIHPDADKIKNKFGIMHWKNNYETSETVKQYKKYEQSLAWPGQVAKKLGVAFNGRARGGSSMMWSLHCLETAILKGDITANTLVLFGTTTKERILYFHKRYSPPRSVLLNYQELWPEKWDVSTVFDMFNDEALIWNHLLCINRLLQLSDMLDGRIQIYETLNPFTFQKTSYDTIDPENLNILKHKYEEIRQHKNYHHEKPLMSLCRANNVDQHGGRHPKLHIHEQFSEHVLENLK